MKRILDYGAGWKAIHTLALRADGFDVTAHDYGRNFDPSIHAADALGSEYGIVMASNVLNVQTSPHALTRCIQELALATAVFGYCVANYPDSPRKLYYSQHQIDLALQAYFSEVDRLPGGNTVWICKGPRTLKARIEHKAGRDYSPEEIAASNIRPAGAVGGKAIVPRIVRGLELAEPIA